MTGEDKHRDEEYAEYEATFWEHDELSRILALHVANWPEKADVSTYAFSLRLLINSAMRMVGLR